MWEPIVTKFEARENVELIRVSGIIHRSQSETVLAELRERLILHNSFALAAIEAMTSLSASLVIGLTTSIAANQSDAIGLWRAACLEEEWQADLWGRDLEAEERRAKRQRDFLKAWQMAQLAQGR